MKQHVFFIVLTCILIGFSSCKSSFEKVRMSNDPVLMRKEADKYFKKEKYEEAQILYESIIPYFRGKDVAADIFYKYAYTHYNLNQLILANHYFKKFSDTYFNDANREDALFMAAYSNYEMSPSAKLDQSFSDKAVSGFQEFINTFPNSKRVKKANAFIDEIRKKQEEKAYMEGKLYFDLKQYQSAIVSLENMMTNFPESKKREDVQFKIVQSAYFLAKNSVYSKKKERYEEAIKRIHQFQKKYPKSKNLKNVSRFLALSKEELNQL